MIGAVAGEVAVRVAEARNLRRVFGAARVIHDVRNAKAQEIDVEMYAVFHIRQVEAEMTEPANFKGLVEQHAADVEFAV